MSDTSGSSDINLLVGSPFTTLPQESREEFEQEREFFSDIQDWLREEGIEVDLLSRPGVEVWEGSIDRVVDFYQLRLIALYLERGIDIAPILNTDALERSEELDPVLESILENEEETRFSHLIDHEMVDGYYLPVDFAEPVWLPVETDEEEEPSDEEEGNYLSFGSSVALQRELVELRDMLNSAGVPEKHSAFRCLNTLFEATSQSIANDLPIVLW
jgi:hypothetical protein